MRTIPAAMRTLLENSNGIFLGQNASDGRVTVEPDWWLNIEASDVGTWPIAKRPVRWYQRADNSQLEVEIPNIEMIQTDRATDQRAASATISMKNTKMRPNIPELGATPPIELGMPGYFTFNYGTSPEAQARWGHVPNEWNDVLVQGALLRTYEGYGSRGKTLGDAITDGNLVLTGVWIVDDVRPNSRGQQQFICRDVMGLCIDQQLFPPLVPLSRYPLSYARWVYTDAAINAKGRDFVTTANVTPGPRSSVYNDSSENTWYPSPGNDPAIWGHRPSEATDGDPNTYWLSVGNAVPDAGFSFVWLQYDTAGQGVNAVYINPWGGDYTCYVSVMENGVWQGVDTIPYDFATLPPQTPRVDTGANIPYVTAQGIGWETPTEIVLPRVYAAQLVRITFTNLTYSGLGQWKYRAGVREFEARVSTAGPGQTTNSTLHVEPVFYGAANILDPTNLNTAGYLTVSQFGQVDAFGDARAPAYSGGDPPDNSTSLAIAFSDTRKGYYVMNQNGSVACYGDAQFFGSSKVSDVGVTSNGNPNLFRAIVVTLSGNGYWLIRGDGSVTSFGDAASYAAAGPLGPELIFSAVRDPNSDGLWILDTAGRVYVRGGASDFGSFTEAALTWGTGEYATDIACTVEGDGYWIITDAGRVQAFGAAVDFGQSITLSSSPDGRQNFQKILPSPSGLGYLIMRGDGTMFPIGTVDFFGSPTSLTAQLRSDGDYTDYVDIIRDLLLWSGFFLKRSYMGTEDPEVYGNLETTGAYSDEPLQADLFDKRPVIDAIDAIAEVVGYLVFADEEGAAHFESPNWWASGNFDEFGNHSDNIPELDERIRLTEYAVTATKRPIRSKIIVSSTKVDPKDSSQIYASYTPQTAQYLRGMVCPAMWVNAAFTNKKQQQLMAELIALQIWFAIRAGEVTAWCDPAIQINDQVRILERNTSETYIHYVRGKSTTNDIKAGRYTMTLTTNWLGDASQWAITADNVLSSGQFQISSDLRAFLRKSQSQRIVQSGVLQQNSTTEITATSDGTPIVGGGSGSGLQP